MIKYVDYDKDIEKSFGDVLRGAYNKANIWPITEANSKKRHHNGLEILKEELDEVREAYRGFLNETCSIGENTLEVQMPLNIHGHAISLITELLQVLAVCNKYWPYIYGGDNNDQD